MLKKKQKPFTYIIECGNFDSFTSVYLAIRIELKRNASLIRIMKSNPKIWTKEYVNEQIIKTRAFFEVYKMVRNHWYETNTITGLKY